MPLHDWTRVDPNDYRHFHGSWIYAIAGVLNGGRLPAGYYALAEHVTPPIVPDVLTLEGPAGGPQPAAGESGVATLPPATVRFTATEPRRKAARPPQRRIAVRHARGRRLVAVIEVVSPGNKAGRQAFRDFLGKAVGLIDQGIHLLLVDPFPPTARDPRGLHAAGWKAVTGKRFDPPPDKPLTLASYAAPADAVTAFVEPVAVGDVLIDMPLALAPDVTVGVPLEATYQTAWVGFPVPLRPLLEGPPAG